MKIIRTGYSRQCEFPPGKAKEIHRLSQKSFGLFVAHAQRRAFSCGWGTLIIQMALAVEMCTMTRVTGRKSASVVKSLRLFFVAITVFGTIGVSEAACWDDVLAKKDRDLLLMRSGVVYQLLDDARLIAFWFPLARISICDQVGYVQDQVVTYYEIRNKDDVSAFVLAVAPRLWY